MSSQSQNSAEFHSMQGTIEPPEGEPSRRPRAPGRPRIDNGTSDTTAAKRRLQLRQSQQTYRQKKAAATKSHEQRASQLEATVTQLRQMLTGLDQSALQSNLDIQNPEVYAQLRDINAFLGAESTVAPAAGVARPTRVRDASQSENANETARDFAFENSDSGLSMGIEDNGLSILPFLPAQRAASIQPHIIQNNTTVGVAPAETRFMFGLGSPETYSQHEVSFSRRLQRQCIEFSLRLYANDGTDPNKIYRLFRLVPCVQNKERTLPTIKRFLKSGPGGVLEVEGQPFYAIGGAGGHYPHFDRFGNPQPLDNTRLPKRLLGIPYHIETASAQYQEHLKIYGLEDEWFDCQDVAGFLKDMGFRDGNAAMDGWLGAIARPQYNFDMEEFLKELVASCVLLGRAPGFKRSAVEAAFLHARRQSFA